MGEDLVALLAPMRDGIDSIQAILSAGVVTPADVQSAIDERVAPLEGRVSALERARWVWGTCGMVVGVGLGAFAL